MEGGSLRYEGAVCRQSRNTWQLFLTPLPWKLFAGTAASCSSGRTAFVYFSVASALWQGRHCISRVARITLPVVWQGQLFTSIKVMWQGQLVRVSESCDGNSFVQVSESCDGDSFVRVLVMCKGDSFVRGSVIWWGQLCRVWEPGDRDSFVSESLARAALC